VGIFAFDRSIFLIYDVEMAIFEYCVILLKMI